MSENEYCDSEEWQCKNLPNHFQRRLVYWGGRIAVPNGNPVTLPSTRWWWPVAKAVPGNPPPPHMERMGRIVPDAFLFYHDLLLRSGSWDCPVILAFLMTIYRDPEHYGVTKHLQQFCHTYWKTWASSRYGVSSCRPYMGVVNSVQFAVHVGKKRNKELVHYYVTHYEFCENTLLWPNY